MAEAFIQDIEDHFLSCCVCFDQLTDPIGLPCLHAFCFKCLDRWFQSGSDKTKVICPTCKASFPKPKEGIRGFPRHFLVKNLKETVDLQKKVKNCNLCDKKADKHCIDCKKSLCHICMRNHDEFTKDHKVVTIEDYQSGQVTDEGRICYVHGEQVRYYCETEERAVCADCLGLNMCGQDHHRVKLKEAAEKQRLLLQEKAMKKCNETKAKFKEAADQIKTVQGNLSKSKKETITEIKRLENEYITRVREAFQSKTDTVNKIEKARSKELNDMLGTVEQELGQIESVSDQLFNVQRSTSEYLVTHKYTTLSATVTILNQSEPHMVNEELGYLKFEPVQAEVPIFGHILQSKGASKRWKLSRSFVAKGLNKPQGIAVDKNQNIVVSSLERGIKVYTKRGQLKSTVSTKGVVDVAVSPDNRCVFTSPGITSIQCNDMQGKQIFTTPTSDVNNEPSHVNSVAVDSIGRFIVGQVENTISVHHADGSLISKFATGSRPLRLAVTTNDEIVTSYYDHTLGQGSYVDLMDYSASGGNIRVIQRPEEVEIWRPSFVCCWQGEFFVVNNWKGDPPGVYRFTSEGDYLGCVTTEVKSPTGIAVSSDGMELYVAEFNERVIKTFTRL